MLPAILRNSMKSPNKLNREGIYLKLFGCDINIENTLKKIKNSEKITKETALKILNKTKQISTIKSFFYKPIVVITIGAILGSAFFITLLIIANIFPGLNLLCLPACIFDISCCLLFCGLIKKNLYFSYLSLAYKKQSKDASNLINQITLAKNDNDVKKILNNFKKTNDSTLKKAGYALGYSLQEE
jgi:hypothetical protein